MFSNGPTVLTRCSDAPRVLTIGKSYMAGIGSRCSAKRHEWSEITTYGTYEIQLLNVLKHLKESDDQ